MTATFTASRSQLFLPIGANPVFAIIRSVESSGRAVIAISIVLIAQFSLLGLSDYRPTAHFGMLCAIGLFTGQVFELLLMPALLGMQLRKPRRAQGLFTLISHLRCCEKAMDARRGAQARAIPCQAAQRRRIK